MDELDGLLPPDGLAAAQAEAWASGVVAAVDDLDALIGALETRADGRACALLAALAVVGPDGGRRAAAAALARIPVDGAHDPCRADVVGTAAPLDAFVIGDDVVGVRFGHADGSAHTMLVEAPAIRFTDGDLLEWVGDAAAARPVELAEAATRLARVLSGPLDADPETRLNAALADARLGLLGVRERVRLVDEPAVWPAARPDPEGAAAALDLIRSVFGPGVAGAEPAVDAVAATIRPADCDDPDDAELVGALEWADWLGAVIGLVRAGPGATVTGEELVRQVNRCPEITTTVAKQDIRSVAGGFAVAVSRWESLGVTSRWRLTTMGAEVLVPALVVAARREVDDGHVS